MLQEGGTALEVYNFEGNQQTFCESMIDSLSMWLIAATNWSVERVRMYQLSEEGKLPVLLQLRASEPYKKAHSFCRHGLRGGLHWGLLKRLSAKKIFPRLC